jgi:DNA-binding NarL/FixJ family response regulator
MVMSSQTPTTPIRVLIVDDHAVVREGITALLGRQTDMVAVGEASDGPEAVARFSELAPDVTLMDMQMDEMDGVEAIEQIRRLSPRAKILVLTTYPGDARVVRAMRAGAAGYLLKNCIRKELLDAIRLVHAGRRALSPDIAFELAEHALDEPLTERELTVLHLVADGHPNKQIASQLSLSTDTIKAHLKNIFAKLGVNDRTEAVTVAARRGFLGR